MGGLNLDKIGGIGLVNIIVIWVFFVVITVGMKAVLTKYHVDGLSEIVQAV